MHPSTASPYTTISGTTITFSPCCDDFVLFQDSTIVCTGCMNTIKELAPKENIVLRYKSNINSAKIIRPKEEDLYMKMQEERMKRYSNDETYELCDTKCPECGANSRYFRAATGIIRFICSNTECRYLF